MPRPSALQTGKNPQSERPAWMRFAPHHARALVFLVRYAERWRAVAAPAAKGADDGKD